MAITQLRSKYQFTLPKIEREKLGWKIGDLLYAWIENDEIVIAKSLGADADITNEIYIRGRFQLTLPRKIYSSMNLCSSSVLDLIAVGERLIINPKIQLVSATKSTPQRSQDVLNLDDFDADERLLKLAKDGSSQKRKSLKLKN